MFPHERLERQNIERPWTDWEGALMTVETALQGTVADGFEQVRDEFAAVVAEEVNEPGAQLAAYWNGRQVVDL